MSTEITLESLIKNPPGPHTRHIAARYAIIADLERRSQELMTNDETKKRFRLKVYHTGTNPQKFLLWIKVPSKTFKTIDYDVLFELTFAAGLFSVKKADAKIFTNSMSWVFTYGFVAKKEGFLIDGWDAALGRAASDTPETTNPDHINGFDKIIFQAIYWLLNGAGMLTSTMLLAQAERSDSSKPSPGDPYFSAERKLFDYTRAKERAAEEARREKQRKKLEVEKEEQDETNRANREARRARQTSNITTTKTIRQRSALKRSRKSV